jgi:hypothetical protein
MGSSTSRSFYSEIISKTVGLSVLNVGLDGAALIYSRCLLELVLRYDVAPKFILLNLDLFELRKTAWSGNYYSMIEYFAPLYGRSKYIDQALNKGKLLESLKYKLASYKYNNLLLTIILKKLQAEKEYRREPAPAGILRLPIEEQVLREKFPDDPEIDPRKTALLNEFITVCKKNNIFLVVVTPPIFNPLYKTTNSDKVVENTIRSITMNRGIPFLAVTQERYKDFRDFTMFSDVLHLNDKGSRLFTYILCNELRDLFSQWQEQTRTKKDTQHSSVAQGHAWLNSKTLWSAHAFKEKGTITQDGIEKAYSLAITHCQKNPTFSLTPNSSRS